MNIEVNLLVVRTKDGIYHAEAIGEDGIYEEIQLEYSPDYVTKEDILEWGKNRYGSNVYDRVGKYLDAIENDMCFYIQSEARHLPSIGNMKVCFETAYLEVR